MQSFSAIAFARPNDEPRKSVIFEGDGGVLVKFGEFRNKLQRHIITQAPGCEWYRAAHGRGFGIANGKIYSLGCDNVSVFVLEENPLAHINLKGVSVGKWRWTPADETDLVSAEMIRFCS